jgi:virginiamycin B lyase
MVSVGVLVCAGFVASGLPTASGATLDDPPPAATYPACGTTLYPFPEQYWGKTLTLGADGAFWFPLSGEGSQPQSTNLGRFDPASGAFSFVTVPGAASVSGLYAGNDGGLWMLGSNGGAKTAIVRYDPVTAAVTAYPLSAQDGGASALTMGPDGAIWFTESDGTVGRLALGSGAIERHAFAGTGQLSTIAVGPDGDLWVAAPEVNAILRIEPDPLAMTSYVMPLSGLYGGSSDPDLVHAGPDGGMWFSQSYAMTIGRIDPATGVLTEHPAGVTPAWLTTGGDGAIWFSDQLGAGVGRMDTTTGYVSECSLGFENEVPFGIATGPNGDVWVTEASVSQTGVNAIARVTMPRTVTDTESFVTAAYWDFLGRLPSADERSTAAGLLDSGGESKAAFLSGLAASPAWVDRIVAGFYRDTLGRDPDSGGLAFWTNQIVSGRLTVAQVAAAFYASGEYFDGIGGGTDATWVSDLYEKILHRDPDRGGLGFWVQQVPVRGRAWVAFNFYQSPESGSDRVSGLYERLLHREPDAGGLQFWTGQVLSRGDLVLAVELAASDEYAADAVARFR